MREAPREFLKVENVKLSYGESFIIEDFSFSIAKGEIVAILGPSGCGKTSLLNMISGVLNPTKGKISLEGQNIGGSAHHASYMFQDDLLVPWRSVYKNVLLPLEIEKGNLEKATERVIKLLKAFGLGDSMNLYPHQLSGGMRRRAAFVRTLSVNKDLYLFDEPTAGLDYLLRLQLEEQLLDFLVENEKTVLMVTHDIETAVAIADKILILSSKPSLVKRTVDVMLGRKLGSPISARADKSFSEVFKDVLGWYKEIGVQNG